MNMDENKKSIKYFVRIINESDEYDIEELEAIIEEQIEIDNINLAPLLKKIKKRH
jgi:hypothetical protein